MKQHDGFSASLEGEQKWPPLTMKVVRKIVIKEVSKEDVNISPIKQQLESEEQNGSTT